MSEKPPATLPTTPIEKQTLISLMRRTFQRMGRKNAITFLRNGLVETHLSFHELDQDSDSMAHAFLERGVRKGDRAIIYLPKCVRWVVAHVALQKIGAVGVPLNPAFKKNEVEFFFRETKPGLAVVGMDQEKTVTSITPDVALCSIDTNEPYRSPTRSKGISPFQTSDVPGLQDPAILVFTSGTTGRPKGAVLTQGNLSHDAQNVAGIWEITREDVFCHALPLFHVHGLCFGLHTALLAGATIVMLDSFDPDVVLDVLSRKDTTMFMAVPTMYARLLERHPAAKTDYSHLRLLTSGSAPLLEKDFERITRTFGAEPVEREGMSETLMNFSNPIRGRRKPGSIGLPLPHLRVRIVNPDTFDDGQPGQIGEIWLKGPAITPATGRIPGKPNALSKMDGSGPAISAGRMKKGYYYLTDRIKNIIISGGENVSPKEIEMVINSNDAVLESCVVGIPDDTWGEIVVAAVVIKPESTLTTKAITALCKNRLLDWKCPKQVLPVNELPRNRMGKVLIDNVKRLFVQ